MPDPQGFARRIFLRAERLDRNVGTLVKKVAVAIDQALVFSTPVATGRARSNWIASLGSPSRDVVPPLDSPQQVVSQAEAVIQRRGRGQDIYISNNLPYIGRLNEGWSAQAPAGFVERAIQTGAQAVKGVKLLDN